MMRSLDIEQRYFSGHVISTRSKQFEAGITGGVSCIRCKREFTAFLWPHRAIQLECDCPCICWQNESKVTQAFPEEQRIYRSHNEGLSRSPGYTGLQGEVKESGRALSSQ